MCSIVLGVCATTPGPFCRVSHTHARYYYVAASGETEPSFLFLLSSKRYHHYARQVVCVCLLTRVNILNQISRRVRIRVAKTMRRP